MNIVEKTCKEMFLQMSTEEKDHADRVGKVSLLLFKKALDDEAVEDQDLKAEYLPMIYHAGLFHDIGKVSISREHHFYSDVRSNSMLNSHTHNAQQLFFCSEDFPIDLGKQWTLVAQAATTHHEAYNGNGLPGQLKGDNIPLIGRIVALADALDHFVTTSGERSSDKRYKAACRYIEKNSNTKFDPKLVKSLVKHYKKLDVVYGYSATDKIVPTMFQAETESVSRRA